MKIRTSKIIVDLILPIMLAIMAFLGLFIRSEIFRYICGTFSLLSLVVIIVHGFITGEIIFARLKIYKGNKIKK